VREKLLIETIASLSFATFSNIGEMQSLSKVWVLALFCDIALIDHGKLPLMKYVIRADPIVIGGKSRAIALKWAVFGINLKLILKSCRLFSG
jgi:hypothetical protein